MTGENTHVETDELRAWSGGARHRGNVMADVADTVGRQDIGLDVFGLIHRAYCGDFIDRMRETLDQIRNTAEYLGIDSDDAVAVADSFDDVNQAQADRFTRGGGHG
jgi:hypothetical protein